MGVRNKELSATGRAIELPGSSDHRGAGVDPDSQLDDGRDVSDLGTATAAEVDEVIG
jgi:hypothetical protein